MLRKLGIYAALTSSILGCNALAQEQVPQPQGDDRNASTATPSPELTTRRAERAEQLAQIEDAVALTRETISMLENEVEIIKADRESLNTALIDAAARVQALETSIVATEERLQALGAREDVLRASFAQRRELLGQVLAALQRMGRNPPPALLVGPSDALETVRSAILMGAVVPEMRDEANALLADLTELRELKDSENAARESFRDQAQGLRAENTRIALLVEQKTDLQQDVTQQLTAERERAEALAARANSLNELITALETEIEAAALAAQQAAEADAARKAEDARLLAERDAEAAEAERKRLAAIAATNTARLAPAIAFSQAKGLLIRPAAGVEVKSFGTRSTSIDQTQGVLFATRPNAAIVTPADGWVLYAGNYRQFGELVIINAGDDHHIVMAGMAATDVKIGQFVLAGEPIGRMGSTALASAASLDVPSDRPLLYVEFRADGVPVDPAPWWAPASGDTAGGTANGVEQSTTGDAQSGETDLALPRSRRG
ncbi:MAG: peptidoglycan DD-metalloendopeptidase family protein [Pseudomonadota bacterium]